MRSLSAAELARLVSGAQAADEPGPAYGRLAAAIRLLILDGRLAIDVRLPSERDLATALDVSRTTVTAGYDALRTAGYAASRRGSGTWTTLPDTSPSDLSAVPWAPAARADVIDLAHASPDAPAQALRAAYDHALAALPHHLPGHGYNLLGLTPLREAVARRFSARGLPTRPEQILVTAGAQHALSLMLALTVGAHDRVLVEHPTYPNALDAIRRVGARAVPVALTDTGWDVAAVAAALRQTAPRLAYLVPDFNNPSGLLATDVERRELAAALARARTTVVVDETLVELGFVPTPPPFATYGADVVTVGSASKTFWGGLRIGWIRAEPSMIRRLAAVRASIDNASPVLEQLAVADLVERIDDVVPARREQLRDRRDTMLGLLADRLPEWSVGTPAGGLVLWCTMSEPVSSRLAATAANYGLRLAAGPRFGVDGAFEGRIRLPYTYSPDVLERAIDLVAQAYRATIATPARERLLDTFA